MKSMKDLAQQALDVQNASNLSGVVAAFREVMIELWEHARVEGHGTDWVNTHPIAKLWSDKVAHLTGTQAIGNDAVTAAYAWANDIVGGEG